MRSLKTIALILLLLAMSASATLAQTATGEVNGTITDPNGIQNLYTPSAVTINSNATSILAGAGRITALVQGTTPRNLQFGIRFVF
jgi:hypothetical protein